MTMERITGKPAHREGRCIGPSHDDRAGVAQVSHHGAVLLRHQVLLDADTVGVGKTLLVDVDLDRDRYPCEYAWIFAGRDLLIDRRRRGERLLGHLLHHGVDFRIDVLQSLQALFGHFGCRDVAVCNPGCDFGCAEAPQFSHRSFPAQRLTWQVISTLLPPNRRFDSTVVRAG